MAKNIRYDKEAVPCIELTVPVGTVSGDPVEFGSLLHGMALTTRDSNGKATVKLNCLYIAEFTVEAKVAGGNSAVALYDVLYFDTAETIKINKDGTNGYPFGVALGTVSSGSSGAINVAVIAGMGSFLQAATAVVSADSAIAIPTRDTRYYITKAGVAAMTLADPTAGVHDGLLLSFISATAQAHTLSNAAGSGFNAGGAGSDIGTFGGAIGDGIVLEAYNGKWLVRSKTNVTLG